MEPWFTNAGCCLPAWASLNLNMRAAVNLRRCCKGNWYSTTPPPPVLLVTVPLCPLYNPGNPRRQAAWRGGNGAGQSAAGTAPAHRAAEVKVTMGLSSRFHPCGAVGPTYHPSHPPHSLELFSQPLWSLIISWKRFFNTCFIYDNGQSWGRKLAFFCSGFGFELRKRGGTRQQCQRVLSHPLATASSSPYLPTKCIHNYR